jgi:hypothetical protein
MGNTPTTADIQRFIVDYYGLLPGDLNAAWQRLSPHYQRQTGFAAFAGFYNTIAHVQVRRVTVLDPHTATAVLVFTKRNGGVSTESYRFKLIVANGRLLIDNAQLLSPAAG